MPPARMQADKEDEVLGAIYYVSRQGEGRRLTLLSYLAREHDTVAQKQLYAAYGSVQECNCNNSVE